LKEFVTPLIKATKGKVSGVLDFQPFVHSVRVWWSAVSLGSGLRMFLLCGNTLAVQVERQFFSMAEYQAWMASPEASTGNWRTKYYKVRDLLQTTHV
jgi:hypothetical protein